MGTHVTSVPCLGVLDGIRLILAVLAPLYISVQGLAAPGRPRNVSLLADMKNIGVTWDPPATNPGIVRKYIVSWAILPNFTEIDSAIFVDGHVNVSLIPIGGNAGRLYRVRVRAQNEAGLGPYSRPRFIRTECGKSFYLEPRVNLTLSSPDVDTADVLPGVLCVWNISTGPKFVLSFHIHTLDITNNNSSSMSCQDTFVNITGYGMMCRSSAIKQFRLDFSITIVTLRTGAKASGSGVRLIVSSVPRLPGSPVRIGVHALLRGVVVTWQQPMENTLPITSYDIQYSVVSLRRTFKVSVGASMRQFAVNTRHYEGKLMTFALTAAMGQLKGQMSRSQYIRASCHRDVILTPGKIRNISSPNYPSHYPSDIICTWSVSAAHGLATRLHVTYLDFRLEATPFCRSDYLIMSFKTTKEPGCARMKLPKTLVLEHDKFTMTFVTDGKHEFEGFLVQVESQVLPTTSIAISSTTSSSTLSSSDPSNMTHGGHYGSTTHTLVMATSNNNAITHRSSSFVISFTTRRTDTVTKTANGTTTSTDIATKAANIDTTMANMVTSSTVPTPMTHHSQNEHGRNRSRVTIATQDHNKDNSKLVRVTVPSSTEVIPGKGTTTNIFAATPAAYGSVLVSDNTTKCTTTRRSDGRSGKWSVVPLVVSISCALAFAAALVILTRRARRGQRAIQLYSEKSTKGRPAQVELHDILHQYPRDKQTSPSSPSNSHDNYEYMCSNISSWRRSRRRTNSFPMRHHGKADRQLEKCLSTFSFIDDRTALAINLHRTLQRHRASSF